MNGSQSSDDRTLMRRIQRLVGILGLDSGRLTMEVHQGAIPFVVVEQRLRIPVGPGPSNVVDFQEEESVVAGAAQAFVRTQLEPIVCTQLGDFGRLVVEVKDGIVAKGDIVRKVKREEQV
jgi:hypothetical protein